MDNPGGDPPKRPQKTLAERRKAAKIAERITRQRMEDEELARAEEEQRIKQAEKVHEEEEYELVRKEAQEQLDYEMAVKMSDIPSFIIFELETNAKYRPSLEGSNYISIRKGSEIDLFFQSS